MSETVKGQFTIDLARAREKLGRYQLADPHAYILEFVQAAVLREAKRIEVFVDSDDLIIAFDGLPFQMEELHNLEMAVLEGPGNSRQRSRRRMAMGLLAVQSLQPASMVIESENGHRWEKKGKSAAILSEPKGVVKGNQIKVKMPWSLASLLDYVRTRKEFRPEEHLLRKHCRLSSVQVIHNGTPISQDPTSGVEDESLSGVRIFADGCKGWGGLVPGRPAQLTLIANGVLVETIALELGAIPFQAVVEGSRLSTDISGTSIQKDEAYEAVLREVKKARGRSLAGLTNQEAARYAEQIREEIFSLQSLSLDGDPRSYPVCLAAFPIWKCSDGRNLSLMELDESVKLAGYLPYSVELHLEEQLEGCGGILYADFELQKKLGELTGWATRNVTRRLRQQAEAKANYRAWKARPAKPVLTGHDYASRASFTGKGFFGEVGVKKSPSLPLIRVVVESCLLCELTPRGWPLGLEAVIGGEFQTVKTYDNILHDTRSVRGFLEMLTTVRRIYEALAEWDDPSLQSVLADFLRVASMTYPVMSLLSMVDVPLAEFSNLVEEYEWKTLEEDEESILLDVEWVKGEGDQRFSVRDLKTSTDRSSPLVVSDSQKNTLNRLLGDSLVPEKGNSAEEKAMMFRLDPTELTEERFLSRVRSELGRVIKKPDLRLGGFNLSRLSLSDGSAARIYSLSASGSVELHRHHPLIQKALAQKEEDPALLLLLVSVLFTAINAATAQVCDQEELNLQSTLADYFVTAPARLQGRSAGEPRGVFLGLDKFGVCSGWADDPGGLGVRFYFQDPGPKVEPDSIVPLETPREEGGFHFKFELPPTARDGERRLIHACLIHPEDGHLVELDGSPRAYAEPHTLPAKPVGKIVEVTDDGECRGWCVDPNDPQGSPQVEFYLDGDWKAGEWLGYSKANLPNEAVEELTGFRGNHGFQFKIPSQYRDGCKHTLCAYGFDLESTAGNPLLEGSPHDFILVARHLEGNDAWSRGREALEAGDFETAVQELKIRLKKGGDQVPDDEVWSWLGAAHSALEQHRDADVAYTEAIKLAPWQSEHWYFSGLVKVKRNQVRIALDRFRKALEKDSDNLDARFELARLTDSFDEAVSHWETLLEKKGFLRYGEAYSALLDLYLEKGQGKKAAELLKKAEGHGVEGLAEYARRVTEHSGPQDSLPEQSSDGSHSAVQQENRLFRQARDLADDKEYDKALAMLKGLVTRGRFDGSLHELWSEVGRANEGMGRFDAARRAYQKALTYEPRDVHLWCALAKMWERLEDTGRAKRALQEAVNAQPDSPLAYFALGDLLTRTGEKDEALGALEKCLQLDTEGRFQEIRERLKAAL